MIEKKEIPNIIEDYKKEISKDTNIRLMDIILNNKNTEKTLYNRWKKEIFFNRWIQDFSFNKWKIYNNFNRWMQDFSFNKWFIESLWNNWKMIIFFWTGKHNLTNKERWFVLSVFDTVKIKRNEWKILSIWNKLARLIKLKKLKKQRKFKK